MRRTLFFVVAAIALTLIATERTVLAQAPPRTVDVSDPQDGGRLMVFAGDTLRVRLRSTPGTGYSWQIVQVDKNVLAQKKAPVFVPPPQDIPGAEGHIVFDFRAAQPGNTTLQLAYTRPWEKNTPPARTFNIEVTVSPASERPLPQP